MVEADSLRHRLDVLLDALSDLRRYRDSVKLEQLEHDRDAQHMVLHALYVAVQAVIDIAFHASADAEQALSTTYRAVFDRLVNAQLLDAKLAGRLAGWAGLRNILAHQYAGVDFERIHRALKEELGDAGRPGVVRTCRESLARSRCVTWGLGNASPRQSSCGVTRADALQACGRAGPLPGMVSVMGESSALHERDLQLGYALFRVGLGVNIAMHGFSRLGDVQGFVDGVVKGFASTPLPRALVSAFAWGLPAVEAVVGTLIVLGLFTRGALVAGTLVMIGLTFGVCLQQNWNVAGLQLPYIVTYALLIAGLGLNRYAVDALLGRRR